jgi:hypothetical protein
MGDLHVGAKPSGYRAMPTSGIDDEPATDRGSVVVFDHARAYPQRGDSRAARLEAGGIAGATGVELHGTRRGGSRIPPSAMPSFSGSMRRRGADTGCAAAAPRHLVPTDYFQP